MFGKAGATNSQSQTRQWKYITKMAVGKMVGLIAREALLRRRTRDKVQIWREKIGLYKMALYVSREMPRAWSRGCRWAHPRS